MTLYPIQTLGITAWCSDLIVDPQDQETVFFLSVCGYQVTVKGIMANFLERTGINIKIEGNGYFLWRSDMSYRVQMKKLPSGLVQAVAIPKLALSNNEEEERNRFFVFSREIQDIRSLFFRNLDERTEIPLHPSWASWLWKTFQKQEDWLIELNTLAGSFKGYLFDFHPTELQDLIVKAIRKKVPEVVDCMVWKGGNGHGTLDPA